MKTSLIGTLGRVAGAIAFAVAVTAVPAQPTLAAQSWSCVCKGKVKSYHASTRHCELHFGVPKGKYCSREQYRQVYEPLCKEMGCRLNLAD